jgi:hypothetical protein
MYGVTPKRVRLECCRSGRVGWQRGSLVGKERPENATYQRCLLMLKPPCPRNLVFLDFAPAMSPNPIPSFNSSDSMSNVGRSSLQLLCVP